MNRIMHKCISHRGQSAQLRAAGVATILLILTGCASTPEAPTDSLRAAEMAIAQAEKLAGDDSWERIGVGRVAYTSGDKSKGEAIFSSVLGSPKVGKSDLYRIAVVYATTKEWSKAKPLFERAIAMDKEDDTGMLKIGCWFNVNGDRARAEQLFDSAFAHSPDAVWHHILAAGSYVGIEPF